LLPGACNGQTFIEVVGVKIVTIQPPRARAPD